jgi:hypothetical protein
MYYYVLQVAYPGGFVGYLGEPSQVAAGGRPLAVAVEVGREGGEGGAVREAARAVFESVGEGAGLGLLCTIGGYIWNGTHMVRYPEDSESLSMLR